MNLFESYEKLLPFQEHEICQSCEAHYLEEMCNNLQESTDPKLRYEYAATIADSIFNYEFTYIVRNPQNGLVKIGITKNIKTRFYQLCSQSGIDLHLWMVVGHEAGYDEKPIVLEKFLHKFYKSKKVRGEWFNLSARDIVDIRVLLFANYDYFEYNPTSGNESSRYSSTEL